MLLGGQKNVRWMIPKEDVETNNTPIHPRISSFLIDYLTYRPCLSKVNPKRCKNYKSLLMATEETNNTPIHPVIKI